MLHSGKEETLITEELVFKAMETARQSRVALKEFRERMWDFRARMKELHDRNVAFEFKDRLILQQGRTRLL